MLIVIVILRLILLVTLILIVTLMIILSRILIVNLNQSMSFDTLTAILSTECSYYLY